MWRDQVRQRLKCAHDYAEADEVLRHAEALLLDLHFALPEERLLPEDKLPSEARARRAAVEDLRRRQGLLILDRLRAAWPSLPMVMLPTTGAELGQWP